MSTEPALATARLQSIVAVALGAIALLWIVLLNGQPFFWPDTSTYVREVDAAIVRLFGPSVATSWTNLDSAPAANTQSKSSGAEITAHNSESDSPKKSSQSRHIISLRNGIVLEGRSVYYGVLLYAGDLIGGFWFTVSVQALIVSYVIFFLFVKCLSLSLRSFLFSICLIALFSTAPFYVGLLMPDIFAAVTILTSAILLLFWPKMTTLEHIMMATLLAFSIMCHTSHLLLCACIVSVYIFVSSFTKLRSTNFRVAAIATVAICLFSGALAELAFNRVVSDVLGFAPIRPPFITARLIDLGPGLKYLVANCPAHPLAVCGFLDRLPQMADTFLWSQSADNSVFATAPTSTKVALGNEQFLFFVHVLMFDPLGVLFAALRAASSQLITCGLSEFHYCADCSTLNIADLPARYQTTIRETLSYRNIWPIAAFTRIDAIVVVISVGLIVGIGGKHKLLCFGQMQSGIFAVMGVIVTGLISNAIICGLFSTIHDRYQARVVWLLPCLAMAMLCSEVLRRDREYG